MMKVSLSSLRAAALIGLAASSAAAQSLLGLHGEVVAAAGDPVNGVPGVTHFLGANGMQAPKMDQNGTLLFRSQLSGAVIAGEDNAAIFLGRGSGDLQMFLRAGAQAPGLPTNTLLRSATSAGISNILPFSSYNEYFLIGSAIYDPITPANTPTTSDSALFWANGSGTIVPLIREGTQADGGLAAGILYGAVTMSSSTFQINKNGFFVCPNTLTTGVGGVTTANDSTVWTGFPGALVLMAREGDPAPLGFTWGSLTLTADFTINDNGDVAWSPRLAGTAGTIDDECLAMYEQGLGHTIWARENDPAPGMAGVVLAGSPGWSTTSWNNARQMAFKWSVSGPGIGATNDEVIWFGGPAGYVKVLQENDLTGFAGSAARFGSFTAASVRSNNGTIGFVATGLRDAAGVALPTTEDTAQVYGTPGNWIEILREGQVVTAITPSVNGPWVCESVSGAPEINSLGVMMWRQSCFDGVVSQVHWLCYNPAHGLRVFATHKEMWTTSQGTFISAGSINSAAGTPSSDGGSALLNNAGDVSYKQSLDLAGGYGAMVRGHIGTMTVVPSSVPASGGIAQQFFIDAGPSHGNSFYFVLATALGTRPGFPSPIGPQQIPLNFDPLWTNLSISAVNSPIWVNTLGITDANGVGLGVSGFVMPTGFPGFNDVTVHHAALFFDLSITSTFVTEPCALLLY